MAISPTDLSNCDLEPIHIPGKIQSRGFLLVTDNTGLIRFISTNTKRFVGEHEALLERPLLDFERLLDLKAAPGFLTNLIFNPQLRINAFNADPVKVNIRGFSFNLIVTVSHDFILLEFEPAAIFPVAEVQKMIIRSIPGILGGADLGALLNYAAVQVKAIIQFDRVMIYRFAPDGHGEVVAEARNEDLTPWLGLHYPASDIPRQAREMYKLNLTRLIADVQSEDTPIVTKDPAQVLDLSLSQLRAVSPIHIQYLKNMGVASSYSISLLYQKELWGLIACHNYTPRFIDYETRESSKLVGQILSAALEFRQHSEDQQSRTIFQHNVDMLARYLNSKSSFEDALMRQDTTLLDVVHASGAVLVYNEKQVRLGSTPTEIQIADLMDWINSTRHDGIFYTSSLCVEYPPAEIYQRVAAGIMVVPLSGEFNEYIIWFKEEIMQEVNWAGDPSKPVIISADGMMNISPRHSFAAWTKTITGKSVAWLPEEISAVLQLKEAILTAISTRASATRILNERLKTAYEELDTFSYTISHDLKTPLTAIKGYAQVLESDQTVSDEGRQILKRIVNRADKMDFMIRSVLDYSRIGRVAGDLQTVDIANIIKEILQDMEHAHQTPNLQITVGHVPALQGDPVMIWQVFNNLIANAVKYSQYAAFPAIHIEGWTSEKQIFYTIKDNGIGIPQKDLDNIFLLFSRMSNVAGIEGSGVGLAIVKKIVEKHGGIIWAESELGLGTTFFLSFTTA